MYAGIFVRGIDFIGLVNDEMFLVSFFRVSYVVLVPGPPRMGIGNNLIEE